MKQNRLWYRQPARNWEEALPLGNGKLGAMIYGAPIVDVIQLNEDSIWSEKFVNRDNPDTYQNLSQIRGLLKSGKVRQAEQLAKYAMTGCGPTQPVYQTLGNLNLEMTHIKDDVTNYRRELDLEHAIATTSFNCRGVTYTREYLTSNPQNSLVIHLTASEPEQISFNCSLNREKFWSALRPIKTTYDNEIVMVGGQDVQFVAVQKIKTNGGSVRKIGEFLVVEKANEATIVLSVATSFRTNDLIETAVQTAELALKIPFKQLKKRHIEDYQRMFNRVDFKLSGKDRYDLPTDQRLIQYRGYPEQDLGLITLYYNYGRYLLIACSRPGSLPANLQGIWNKDISPHWGSKYTININTEMNYWPAEITNLSELHEPLFDHLARMYPHGRITANSMYHARGWMAHHNTDIWGDTAPQDLYMPATVWPLGAAFLVTHIWQHYQYTEDLDFLKNNFYLLRDAVLFFVDYMVKNDDDEYIVSPSLSPENAYIHPSNGDQVHMVAGATMDSEILWQLFNCFLQASELLDKQDELYNEIHLRLTKLPKLKIHSNGTICEWPEEYQEAEPGHRHISQLYALYPSDQISPFTTPDLANAARATIDRRLKYGGGHTGWSLAWIINMRARLLDGKAAYAGIQQLLCQSTQINLLDLHPPFQIDGNFGGIAAITEMLVQSVVERIVLLPALPKEWEKGTINGIKVKGNLVISLNWERQRVTRLSILAQRKQLINLVYNGSKEKIQLTEGNNIII